MPVEQLVDRPGDRARERQPHAERDDLDDEEQSADRGASSASSIWPKLKVPIGVIGAAEIRS